MIIFNLKFLQLIPPFSTFIYIKTHNSIPHYLLDQTIDHQKGGTFNKHDLQDLAPSTMVFYPSPPTRAANFSNTEFSRECSKLRFGNRCALLKCETVGQTAENVYIRGREGRGEGGMSTRCMYDGDKAHPPIMLSFSLRFLSPLFFSIVRFSLVLLALDIS